MKKTFFGLVVCFFIIIAPVFSQVSDRSQYKAIDPFDYKLDERDATRGTVRKFKSVVRFVSNSGTVFSFSSLDNGTTLSLQITRHITVPSPSQIVTIYYTATKRIIDSLILDEIDVNTTTEGEIGLVKSTVSASSGINKSAYREIDAFGYKMEAEYAKRDEARRYKITMRFAAQNGITYTFIDNTEGTVLTMKVGRRFLPLTPDQKVTIYFTAIKGIVDSLTLDDIEL